MIRLSKNYSQAREQFLSLAKKNNFIINSYLLPDFFGQDGEKLFCDTALAGNPDAKKCLLISSGVHGVEGFCGSAVQARMMEDEMLGNISDEIKILFVHALNPYGFSHCYRVNEDNIDLNRNFTNFDKAIPKDLDIKQLYTDVFPKEWQGTQLDSIHTAVMDYTDKVGSYKFQSDLTKGQYHYPGSPYFGGSKSTWSRKLWTQICSELANNTQLVSHLDIHTGLGNSGDCEVIFTATPNERNLAMARQWYGPDTVKVPGSEASNSATIQGILGTHIGQYPITSVSVALEFGTQAIAQVAQALYESNWLFHNPNCSPQLRDNIQQKIRDAFMVDSEDWAKQVWQHSEQYFNLSIKGLMSSNV